VYPIVLQVCFWWV